MPAAFQQLQFGTDNAENNTRLANAAMTLLDPKNNQSRVDRYSRQVQGEARKKSRSVAMEMAAQGFSRSAESAAKLQSENDARSQTNQYASYLDSPEAVTQAINAINQIFTQTSMGPQLQALMGLAGGQQFYKAEKQKGGLLGGLTPLLGMAASAFFDGTGPFK